MPYTYDYEYDNIMASHTFNQKTFTPTPPDKGSFPLDHENVCKRVMLQYMGCLRRHGDDNARCRPEAQAYLQCRMDHQLMAREEWSKLGFHDDDSKRQQHSTAAPEATLLQSQ